jgi:hypothetical protein
MKRQTDKDKINKDKETEGWRYRQMKIQTDKEKTYR